MKAKFLAAAAIGIAWTCASGGVSPAWADGSASGQVKTSAEARSARELVHDATQTVAKIKADQRFAGYLKKAKGVFIMPTLVKGAFIIGGKAAQGVLLKHNADGSWSAPVFMTIGSISVGAQAGGKAGPAAMILMTNKALNDFTQQNNFSLNASAGLTVIGYSAQGQAPVGKGDIIVWSDQSGAFAGASVGGADLTQNTTEDSQYYGEHKSPRQILSDTSDTSKAHGLRSALAS